MNAPDNRGQAAVVTVLFLTVLLGVTALALDVGSWYRAKRALQATADAAALAGAQALPDSTADARALAKEYAGKNGATLDDAGISFTDGLSAHDTINVSLSGPAPGFFSKLFGIDSVTVAANASARSDNAGAALRVAPIVVNWQHPMLVNCQPLPCADPTEIDLQNLHSPGSGDAAGSFALIDLDQTDNGNAGNSTLAEWITHGFDRYMKPGYYDAVPSTDWNSSQVVDSMRNSIGDVLLFPIYKTIASSGSNAKYLVIGWAGFYVTGFEANGSAGKVYGHFTRRVTEGIQASTGDNVPDYGIRVVQLVN